MMNVKLIPLIVTALLFSFVPGGCWDRTEVSNLAIIEGIGVDRIPGDEPVLLTVQIINPSGMKQGAQGGNQQNPFIVKTSKGKSFFDAIRNLTRDLPRKPYFDHNEIVVFGKDFAESGTADVLDYMERNKEFRNTNMILVAEKTAAEVLDVRIDIETLPAKGIQQLLSNNIFTYPVNRNEFLLGLKSIGVTYAPLIKLVENNSTKKIHIEETAIFKDYRLLGLLTLNESKGLLWLINKLNEDTVVIPYMVSGRAGEVTLDIFEGKTKITPQITEKDITMEIVCKGKASLREAGNTGIAVKKKELFRQLEQITGQILKKRVEQTINRAQKIDADFIGFANHIHNYDPVVWKSLKKDWGRYFPNIKYNVKFQIEIVNVGIYRSSINEIGRKE